MVITRERRFTVSMGSYETYQFGAQVTVAHFDVGLSEDEVSKLDEKGFDDMVERMFDLCVSNLSDALVDEVREAANLTEHQRSFILRALEPAKSQSQEPQSTPRAKSQKVRRIR